MTMIEEYLKYYVVFINIYIWGKDGAHFSYSVDRNNTYVSPLESPPCYLLYDTKINKHRERYHGYKYSFSTLCSIQNCRKNN